jgi:hypothetical protein
VRIHSDDHAHPGPPARVGQFGKEGTVTLSRTNPF